jgi:hypothetical protein
VIERVVAGAVALMAAAAAIYVAVRLLESVATQLLVISGVVGAVLLGRLLWRRHGSNRW